MRKPTPAICHGPASTKFLLETEASSVILEFRPSESVVVRARELRLRNQEGTLKPEEESEMEDLGEIDNLMALLKAEARLHVNAAS
jgi:hypothetical protein